MTDKGWPSNWDERISGEDCSMCRPDRPAEDDYGILIHRGRYVDASLQRADVQRGYALVIWRGRHVVEPVDLSDDEAAGYWLEVLEVARALIKFYGPLKMNYQTLGNSTPHLHTHLVPRFKVDPAPGAPFPLPVTDGSEPQVPEVQLRADAEALREILGNTV